MSVHARYALLGVLLSLGTGLAAQEPAPAAAPPGPDPAAVAQTRLVTPAAAAAFRSGLPEMFLKGSSTDAEVQVEGGLRLPQSPVFGRLYATLEVTSPIAGAGRTELGGPDGLNDGATLSFSLTGLRWRWTSTAAEERAWCERTVARGRGPRIGYDCTRFRLTDFTKVDPALEDEYVMQVATDRPLLYEVSFSASPGQSSYLDPVTYTPASRSTNARSFGAAVGRFFGSQLWGVEYRYEVAFQAAPEAEVCVPVAGAALRCRTGPLGEPARQEGSVASVQTRGFFRRNLAWNPRVTYGFGRDVWSLDVPVYFVPGDDGLIGGAAAHMASDQENWAFSVFVGKSFRTGL
jgi:hypothetical protein